MKIGLISLGCPKNLVDSEVMLGLAREAGHELTRMPRRPTCWSSIPARSSTRPSRSRSTRFWKWRGYKSEGSCQRLIVTGCMAERYRMSCGPKSRRSTPSSAQAKCPTSSRRLAAWRAAAAAPLAFYRPSQAPAPVDVVDRRRCRSPYEPRPSYIYDADTPRLLATPKHYAYIKIAEGCDYTCAFCIIPTLRGAYRSRPAESIVREARDWRRAASRNCCSSRRTPRSTASIGGNAARWRGCCGLNEVDGLEWIRLLYLYPTTIDDETLAAMAECDKVCR